MRAFLNVSLGRARLIVGPAPWLAQIPLVGAVVEGGSAAGVALESAGVAMKTAIAVGALAAGGSLASETTASGPPEPPPTAVAATPAPVASAGGTSAPAAGGAAATAVAPNENPSGHGGTIPPTARADSPNGQGSSGSSSQGSPSSPHATVPLKPPGRGLGR